MARASHTHVSSKGKGTKSSRKRQYNEHLGAPRGRHTDNVVELDTPTTRRDDKPLLPKTENQARYIESIRTNTLSFGTGPAGVGKTFIAVTVGCEMLLSGQIEGMTFTRPAIGSDEELGFFKGDIDEKLAPWVAPIRDVLDRKLGRAHVDLLIKRGVISFQPLATMRGHSWSKRFIMLDEAQNVTPNQMKLLLTRVGEGSTVVVDGDVAQKDIVGLSGLEQALTVLEGQESVGSVHFEVSDIVRSGFVKRVLTAYHLHGL